MGKLMAGVFLSILGGFTILQSLAVTTTASAASSHGTERMIGLAMLLIGAWLVIFGIRDLVEEKRRTEHVIVHSVIGWQPDPTGRHQLRYFDGTRWLASVADTVADDPMDSQATDAG